MIFSTSKALLYSRYTSVNWRKGSGTNVELGVKIIIDFDRVSRILVRREKDRFSLRHDWLSGIQVEKLLRERSGGRVIFRFGESRHGESESEGEMSGLESTVRKVGGEFELSFLGIGRVGDSTSFHLER